MTEQMPMWLVTISVPVVSGLFGWIGGLIAARYQWDIEKQKLIHQSRENRCKEIRQAISQLRNATDVVSSPFWSQLEKNMNKQDREKFFKTVTIVPNRDGAGGHTPDSVKRQSLYRALDQIELDWGVV